MGRASIHFTGSVHLRANGSHHLPHVNSSFQRVFAGIFIWKAVCNKLKKGTDNMAQGQGTIPHPALALFLSRIPQNHPFIEVTLPSFLVPHCPRGLGGR